MSGRNYIVTLELVDKPGQLTDVSKIISDMGGNVISIHHERSNEGSDVNGCFLHIQIETKNFEHIHSRESELRKAGFKIV